VELACIRGRADFNRGWAMVRNARAAEYEATRRPVIAVGNDYPPGHLHPAHRHRRAQLLYGAVGTMIVETEQGAWVVPPQQGVWIPVGVKHSIRMLGQVTTRSVYVASSASAKLPDRCQVVGVSPLLRNLLLVAVDLPIDYAQGSRAEKIMSLLVDEIVDAPVLPLCLPFPAEARLEARCRRFMDSPTPHATIDEWSDALGMSRRAFTRLFRRETGLSFAMWLRQACLLVAVPRLAAGQPVTTVALDLGYSSPSAFSSMFKQVLGISPNACVANGRI
jgi:AraC-like DNA-binding protein/mannose-6-phosphate isomerase-like protein (cupin superfamily)